MHHHAAGSFKTNSITAYHAGDASGVQIGGLQIDVAISSLYCNILSTGLQEAISGANTILIRGYLKIICIDEAHAALADISHCRQSSITQFIIHHSIYNKVTIGIEGSRAIAF